MCEMCVSSHRLSGQDLAVRVPPTTPARSRTARGTGAAPALGTGHLPGDRDRLRLGQDMGPQLYPAWWGPWPGIETGSDVVLLEQGLTLLVD